MKTFEVTAAGFDGGTDETDDRVYWVHAENAEHVHEAIKDTGATYCGEIDVFNENIDYVLPRQGLAFSEALLTWAGHERNKNR
jgi:hypothetical protein